MVVHCEDTLKRRINDLPLYQIIIRNYSLHLKSDIGNTNDNKVNSTIFQAVHIKQLYISISKRSTSSTYNIQSTSINLII